MWRFCCGAEEMHLRAFRLGLAVIGIELLLGILVENTAGVLGALITILSVVVQLLYGIGFIYIYVSLANGDEVGWSHFTEKAELIGKYFLGAILYGLAVVVGLALLIIPGIYIAVTYGFWPYILIENSKMGIFESMRQSAQITKGVKLKIFGAGFIFTMIGIAGFIIIEIGALVTIPLSYISIAVMYATLRDQTDISQEDIDNDDSIDGDTDSEDVSGDNEKRIDADYNTVDAETASDDEDVVNE